MQASASVNSSSQQLTLHIGADDLTLQTVRSSNVIPALNSQPDELTLADAIAAELSLRSSIRQADAIRRRDNRAGQRRQLDAARRLGLKRRHSAKLTRGDTQ